MKMLFVAASLLMSSLTASAYEINNAEGCGLVKVYGVKSYVYASLRSEVTGQYLNITGDTQDPYRQVRRLVNGEVYCIKGSVGIVRGVRTFTFVRSVTFPDQEGF